MLIQFIARRAHEQTRQVAYAHYTGRRYALGAVNPGVAFAKVVEFFWLTCPMANLLDGALLALAVPVSEPILTLALGSGECHLS